MKIRTVIACSLAGILVLIGLILSFAALASVDFDFRRVDAQEFQSRSYEISDPIVSLEISVLQTDVRILPSSDGKNSVVVYSEEADQGSVTVEDGCLKIKMDDWSKWYDQIGLSFEFPHVTVYLNEKSLQHLHVTSSSGDVRVAENLSFERAEITLSSGDLSFRASVHESLAVKAESGDVYLSGIHAENATASTSSGDITLADVQSGALTLRASSGDIELRRVLIDGHAKITTSSGDVELEGADAESFDVKTSSGDVEGYLYSQKIFQPSTGSGDIRVPRPSTEGGLFEVVTGSGDIEISVRKSN